MRIKRFLQLIVIATVANVPIVGISTAEEPWVITGNHCDDGSCASGPFYGQTGYDPYAAPTGGSGNPVLIVIGNKLREAAQNYEPTCVPAGSTEREHRAAQAGLCAVKAIAEVSRALGIAASAISADTARQSCLAEIGLKLGTGDCRAE